MADFCIEIAGQTAQIHSLFESTRDYCRAYLTDKSPAFFITVTQDDLQFEQDLYLAEAKEEGFRIRYFTDPFLERSAIQRKLAEQLLEHDILLLHGSAVAVDGQGYLFTAKSGTGKSTHTRLWREAFGSRAVMVNDDKPFLRFTDSGILLCGSPWSGKHGLDTNITVPLTGICILTRGAENSILPISASDAEAMLRHQSCPPLDPRRLPKYHALLSALLERVPLWQMACTKELQAAHIAHAAMSKAGPLSPC